MVYTGELSPPMKRYAESMEAPKGWVFDKLLVPPAPKNDEAEMMVNGKKIEAMQDAWAKEFENFLPQMVQRAMVDCDRSGVSHRNFKVGCSLLAYNESTDAEVVEVKNLLVYDSGNYTPRPRQSPDEEKQCAERRAVRYSWYEGSTPVVGMVVASEKLQADEISGLDAPVLHPCSACRELFLETLNSGGARPDTQIVLVKFKTEVKGGEKHYIQEAVERYTLAQLLKLHKKE